jgi:hypothetical protein
MNLDLTDNEINILLSGLDNLKDVSFKEARSIFEKLSNKTIEESIPIPADLQPSSPFRRFKPHHI